MCMIVRAYLLAKRDGWQGAWRLPDENENILDKMRTFVYFFIFNDIHMMIKRNLFAGNERFRGDPWFERGV